MNITKRPTMLMILDGFGKAPAGPGNAISLADKPNLDHLFATYPNTQLQCCGEAVGLPEGVRGETLTLTHFAALADALTDAKYV